MNIFHKVTIRNLQKNRVRTLVTIIGIVLSTAMICAVTTFSSSILNFLTQSAIYNTGNYYGCTQNIHMDKIKQLYSDNRLSHLVSSQTIGYAVLEGGTNELKPYLCITGADKDFEKNMPVHLTAGRLPESPQEILIPTHVRSNGDVSYCLGDKLILDIGQRISDTYTLYQNTPFITEDNESGEAESLKVSQKRSYTVVGFYERPDFEDSMAPGYTAITVKDEDPSGKYTYNIYYKTKKAKDIYSFMTDNGLGGSTNWLLLAYSGTTRYAGVSSVINGFAFILIELIVFGSIALIYNAFAISVSERTKQFGLLISIGATKKQLKHSVYYEAMVLSLIGIPLGILSGIGGIGITLELLGSRLNAITYSTLPMHVSVSWVSVASAIIIAFITVIISAWIPSKRAVRINAIEAIRQSQDITPAKSQVTTSSITYKLFGLEGMIAKKHFKRSRKKYKATVVSLAMSIILFISASSLCMYMTDSVNKTMATCGYDIIYSLQGETESSHMDDIYKELSQCTNVKKSAYAISTVWKILFSPECYSQDYLSLMESYYGQEDSEVYKQSETLAKAYVYFIEDEKYEAFLDEHKLDKSLLMDTTSPKPLVYDKYTVFSYDKGKYLSASVLKGRDVPICTITPKILEGYSYGYIEAEGNGTYAVTYENNSTGETCSFPLNEYCDKKIVNIGAITDQLPFCVNTEDADIILMYPYSSGSKVLDNEMLMNSNDLYFTSSNHNATYNAMKAVLDSRGCNTEYGLRDYASEAEEQRNLVIVINVFSYGFIILISLIAAANVFNTISTNIALRRREFAMLRSVGMTSKGFNKMMYYECMLYGIKSITAGLPLSLVVTFIIYKVTNSGYTTAFYIPWTSIAIAILSVFAVVFATMMYAINKIKKDNPIDALRNENL